MIFFMMSFVGWCWEGEPAFGGRRGLRQPRRAARTMASNLRCGKLLVLILLKRFREKPVVQFTLTVVVCGIVEYGTAWSWRRNTARNGGTTADIS